MKQHTSRTVTRRRLFAATAVSLAGAGSRGGTPAPSDMVRVAVLGTGTHGQRLLNACAKIPNVQVCALCDIWEDYNLKRARRILARYVKDHRAYTDYRELLDKEKGLSAVVIATPDCFHAEQTEAALAKGLHVYCEAPLSNSLHGARRIVQAARRSKTVVQIGLQRRSDPRYRYCRDTLMGEVKLLGRVVAANGQWNQPVRRRRGWPRRSPVPGDVLSRYGFASMEEFRNWQLRAQFTAGPVVTCGQHQLDVLLWFVGSRPKAVAASGGTDYYDKKSASVMDSLTAVLQFQVPSGPVRATYQVLSCNGNLGDYERFLGDEGTLLLSFGAGKVEVFREERVVGWNRWVNLGILRAPKGRGAAEAPTPLKITDTDVPTRYRIPVEAKQGAWEAHLANFFGAVRGLQKPKCPPEVAFAAFAAAVKLCEAAQSDRWIACEEEDFIA